MTLPKKPLPKARAQKQLAAIHANTDESQQMRYIADMMLEDPLSSMSPMSSTPPISPITPYGQSPAVSVKEEPSSGFTEKELHIAKRFMELVGGPGRARELLDKCTDCVDCLDLVDDDAEVISQIGRTVPSNLDIPTYSSAGYGGRGYVGGGYGGFGYGGGGGGSCGGGYGGGGGSCSGG